MNNSEQDHARILPGTQRSPLFNADSFPGAEHCIVSLDGFPIPVDAAKFPWFDDFAQADLALNMLTASHAAMTNFILDYPDACTYICNHLYDAAVALVNARRTSYILADGVYSKLIGYLAACLAGKETYGGWLATRLPDCYLWNAYETNIARLDWLDRMIVYVKGNIKQLEENEAAACTQQETYLNTPARWLETK